MSKPNSDSDEKPVFPQILKKENGLSNFVFIENLTYNTVESRKPPEEEKDKKTKSSGDKEEDSSKTEGKDSDDEKSSGDKDAEGEEKKKADDQGEDSEGKKEDGKDKPDDKKPKKKPVYKRPAFIIIAILILLALIISGLIFWLFARQYVNTDDAYIDSHIVQISPQVGARVLMLHIDDNQFVHRGDLLIELDPTDYAVALEQAKAQVSAARGRLEQSKAEIISANAQVAQAIAQEHSAQASLQNTSRDLKRYENVDERARSRQQLDTASTSLTNAQAQVETARAQIESAKANVATSTAGVKAAEGQLRASLADQKRAGVNLSYCKIFAPSDGRVTQRTVEAGNYVTTGQALFMLVDPNVWITANFKETQLTLMRPGQAVTIRVDAFPDEDLRGHVDSIQAGSGSRFSVLPAENATGNYVKIVQRVPVKIVFDHGANTNNAPMLSPGLSVIPKVKVR